MGDNQIVKYDLVIKYFKGVIVTKIKTIISDIIINQKISALEITPRLEEISSLANERLSDEFRRFGIEIINLYISSINFPDEDFKIINKILEEKAAFDIIGDNRYNIKRSFDVMETAAGNESSGNLAAAGIGLGIGASAGIAVGNNFAGYATSVINTNEVLSQCKKCGNMNKNGVKFCSNCGEKVETAKVECYSCKELIDTDSKFCPNCGVSMKKKICKNCNTENLPGVKFCSECGSKMEV